MIRAVAVAALLHGRGRGRGGCGGRRGASRRRRPRAARFVVQPRADVAVGEHRVVAGVAGRDARLLIGQAVTAGHLHSSTIQCNDHLP